MIGSMFIIPAVWPTETTDAVAWRRWREPWRGVCRGHLLVHLLHPLRRVTRLLTRIPGLVDLLRLLRELVDVLEEPHQARPMYSALNRLATAGFALMRAFQPSTAACQLSPEMPLLAAMAGACDWS
jgi:hypothetical protein